MTSRTESSHSKLKRHLINRNTSLTDLHDCIFKFVSRTTATYERRLVMKERREYMRLTQRKPFFQNLDKKISHYSMKLLYEQYDIAIKPPAQGNSARKCSGQFSNQFGLPCWHRIAAKMADNLESALRLEDIHTHWHFYDASDSSEPYGLIPFIQDPSVLPKRQQQRPAPDVSTRRDLSHDELPGVTTTTTMAPARQRAPSKWSKCNVVRHTIL